MRRDTNRGVKTDPVLQGPGASIVLSDTEVREGVRLELAAVAVGVGALPLLTPGGPGNLAPTDVALLLAVGATLLWVASSDVRLRFPYVLGVGTMVVAGTLSSSIGALPGLGLLAVFQDIYLFAWCVAVANVASTARGARLVVRAWAASAALWTVAFLGTVGVHAATGGIAQSDAARLGFTFGEQNGAALYFDLALMVVLAARVPADRVLRACVVAALVTALVLTGSLAGLLGLVVAFGVATVLLVRDRFGTMAAVLATLLLATSGGAAGLVVGHAHVFEWAQNSRLALVRDSIGRYQQSSSERQELASETTGLFRDGGLIGLGPAATFDTLQAEQAPYQKEAHNDYIAALVERGVLGLLGLFILILTIAVRAIGVCSVVRLPPGIRQVISRPAYLTAGLSVLLVFSLSHEVLHDRAAWTYLGLLAAISPWGRPAAATRMGGELA
jgi:O-antigen ligase